MIDLHTHSLLSDGQLLPFELVRRAEARGLRALAITDHVDASNMDIVVPRLRKAVEMLRPHVSIDVIAGAEITHAPPALIASLVKEARGLGAELVLVHGESPVEPVREGTNRAAIVAECDILTHPGQITDDDAALAVEHGVALEITARKGHSLSNGHVAAVARRAGAALVINTDAHAPDDLIGLEDARRVLEAAGVSAAEQEAVFKKSEELVSKAIGRVRA